MRNRVRNMLPIHKMQDPGDPGERRECSLSLVFLDANHAVNLIQSIAPAWTPLWWIESSS